MSLTEKSTSLLKFSISVLLVISGFIHSLAVLAADELCGPSSGRVARAMFTTGIENREPIDRVLILENKATEIYFFTDLRRLQGKTIIHRWEYEGRVVNRKTFKVNGPRWRVYSLHKIDRNMLGRWTVIVTDETGCPLKAVIFEYIQAGEAAGGSAIIDLQ
ncbi:MAG: DUF2914 domain-containing protein [Thioalkalispiraceae bacterium]|jgi:hypothetical protein